MPLLKLKKIICYHLEDKLDVSAKKKDYDLKLKQKRKEKTADIIEKAENKSKVIWKVINSEKGTKPSSRPIHLNINGAVKTNPDIVSNHFNDFFANIANLTLANQPQVDQKNLTRTVNCPDLIRHRQVLMNSLQKP